MRRIVFALFLAVGCCDCPKPAIPQAVEQSDKPRGQTMHSNVIIKADGRVIVETGVE